MSEVVIVGGDDESETVEEVTEAVVEVAEAVSDAIVDAVEAVTEANEEASTSGEETAIVAGITLAEVAHLNQRVDELEARVAMADSTADLAMSLATEAVEEPVVEEVEEEPAPPEDVPPATRKSKFSKWWFG